MIILDDGIHRNLESLVRNTWMILIGCHNFPVSLLHELLHFSVRTKDPNFLRESCQSEHTMLLKVVDQCGPPLIFSLLYRIWAAIALTLPAMFELIACNGMHREMRRPGVTEHGTSKLRLVMQATAVIVRLGAIITDVVKLKRPSGFANAILCTL